VPLLVDLPRAVTVDSGDHLWNLMGVASAIGGGPVTTTVPISGSKSVGGAGSVVLWDANRAGALFNALRTDQPVPPGALST
jgi:hypothetical protein